MPVKLNLLPQGLLVSKSLANVLKAVRSLNVILVVAFLVAGLGIGSYFVISNGTLTSTQNNANRLKTQVLAQESSEQQLILLKDRLTKISTAEAKQDVLKNLNSANSLINGLSTDSSISEMDVTSAEVDLTMTVRSNTDLTTFLQSLKNTTLFKSVVLSSFGYNPVNGYSLELKFNNI